MANTQENKGQNESASRQAQQNESNIDSMYKIVEGKITINTTNLDSEADREEVKRRLLALDTAQNHLFIVEANPDAQISYWLDCLSNVPSVREFNICFMHYVHNFAADDLNLWHRFCLEKNVDKSGIIMEVDGSTSYSDLAEGVRFDGTINSALGTKSMVFKYSRPDE